MSEFLQGSEEDADHTNASLKPYYSATSTVLEKVNQAEISWLEEEITLYERRSPASQTILKQANEVLPAGVASCYHRSPTPFFVKSELSKGSTVVDADGNSYIDFHSGYGVMALGHQHPQVIFNYFNVSGHLINFNIIYLSHLIALFLS